MRTQRTFFGSSNFYGAFLVFLVSIATVASNTLTHALPPSLPSYQILFLKSTLSLLGFLALWGPGPLLGMRRIRGQFLRATYGTVGNWCWVAALLYLPLAQCSALSLTSVLFTSLGGWIIFKEPFHLRLVGGLLLGCVGVVLVVWPVFHGTSWALFLPLLSALFFSLSSLSIKSLSRDDSSPTILLGLTLFMALLTLLPAFWNWQPLGGETWLKLLGIGALYMLTQWGLVEAYTHAAASFIAPFKLGRFPLNILAGLLFFSEVPPSATLLGGSLIIGAYAVLTWGELSKKREKKGKWRAREESNS